MRYIDYQEKQTRGTFSFPLEYHYVDNKHSRYVMPYHWHIEHEIIRVKNGSMKLTIDNQIYNVNKGESIFIPNEALHGGEPKDCEYECLVFDLGAFFKESIVCRAELSDIIHKKMELKPYYGSNEIQINTIVWQLFEIINQDGGAGNELIFKGLLFELIGNILERDHVRLVDTELSHNSIQMNQLKKAVSFIEREYQNHITLDDIAKEAMMSPKYFCRVFKDKINKTPIEYLNGYRVEMSCVKLLTTNDAITEIAYGCGFNDLSYFIRTFKKYKSISPTGFVKINKSNL